MANKFSMDDYIDVAERIVEFNSKFPDGTLQTIDWKVAEVGGKTFIVYRAAAYRTPDDRRPGHGIAWEPFPGPTPYTKDSELMNAETAAWGRAIVACGLPANRKIASKQEVKARQTSGVAYVTPLDVDAIIQAARGLTVAKIKVALTGCGLKVPEPFTIEHGFAGVPKDKAPILVEALVGAER